MPGPYVSREEAEEALRQARPRVDATVAQLQGRGAPFNPLMQQLNRAEEKTLADLAYEAPSVSADEVRATLDRVNQYLDSVSQRQVPINDLVLPPSPPMKPKKRLNLPKVPNYGKPSAKSKRK